MYRVASQCTASLAYHLALFEKTLPSRHIVRATPLWAERTTLNALSEHVVCRRAKPDDLMQPTGVPPHVEILV